MSFTLKYQFSDQLENDGISIYVNDQPLYNGMMGYEGDTLKLVSSKFKFISVGGGFDSATGAPLDEFNLNEDKIEATWVIETNVLGNPVYTDSIPYRLGDPIPVEVTSGFQLTESFNSQLIEDGLTIKVNNQPMLVGDIASVGSVLAIESSLFELLKVGGGFDLVTGAPLDEFDINEDKTVATWIVKDGYSSPQFVGEIPYSLGNELATGGGDTVNQLNLVYKLDIDSAKQVLNERFLVRQGDEWLDYGKYLINMLRVPFNITGYVSSQTTVKLKDLDTNIEANFVNADLLEFDLGSIRVNGVSGDLTDYTNTVAVLYVPYFRPINLDIERVINKDVTIKGYLSLYNGAMTINVLSDGELFLIDSLTLDTKIPFTNLDGDIPTASRELALSVSSGIDSPYIELIKYDDVERGLFDIPIEDSGSLKTGVGYVEVDNILLSGVTGDVKRRIENQLKEGVIL